MAANVTLHYIAGVRAKRLTMHVLLQDFVDESRLYRIDKSSPQIVETQGENKSGHNISGFGAYQKVGLRHRQRKFVALYSTGSTLMLRLDEKLFDFGDIGLRSERTSSGLFVRRFTVYSHQALTLDWCYWLLEWKEWPDNGDIFWWIAMKTATWESRLNLIYFFNARSQGRDVTGTEFRNDQKEWVLKRMQQES